MANRYTIRRLECLGFGLHQLQTSISSDTVGFPQDAAAKETHFERNPEGLWAAENEGTSASHLFSFPATHRRYKKKNLVAVRALAVTMVTWSRARDWGVCPCLVLEPSAMSAWLVFMLTVFLSTFFSPPS